MNLICYLLLFSRDPGSSTLGETVTVNSSTQEVFALSKLYYVAQVLPLPVKQRKHVESCLSKFIFRGRYERLKLGEIENNTEQGGLGLPNIAVKADSLLIKQMCRMIFMLPFGWILAGWSSE